MKNNHSTDEEKPTPNNKVLYEKAKQIVMKRYNNKRSPFVSGAIVQQYKKMGGTYNGEKTNTKLKRWFDEKWVDVSPIVGKENSTYGFFRPTVRINEKTPKLAQELKGNLLGYVNEKQKVKYGHQIKDIEGSGYSAFKPTIIGGMLVKSQPYSKV